MLNLIMAIGLQAWLLSHLQVVQLAPFAMFQEQRKAKLKVKVKYLNGYKTVERSS